MRVRASDGTPTSALVNYADPHDLPVTLLSSSFAAALVVGGIAGRLGGMLLGAGVGALAISAMSFAAAWLSGRAGSLTMDPTEHRALLMVFLLFGALPLAMSLVMFTAHWESRPGFTWQPAPRAPLTVKVCSYARILANLVFVLGFVVTFWDTNLASLGAGFPLVGAGALTHALIGAVAGMRPSKVLSAMVVGVGFVGFGVFAQGVSG